MFLLFNSVLFAQEFKPEIQTDFIYAESEASLENILEDQVGVPSDILHQERYLDKISKWNPQLSRSRVQTGEEIYLELPYGTPLRPLAVSSPLTRPEPTRKVEVKPEADPIFDDNSELAALSSQVSPPAKRSSRPQTSHPKVSNLRAYYLFTAGSFDQQNNEGVRADTQQSSPATFGVQGVVQPFSRTALVYGGRVGQMGKLEIGESEELDLPLEFSVHTGLGLPYQAFTDSVLIPFLTLDYLQTSTFNISELNLGFEPEAINHSFIFASAGLDIEGRAFRRAFHLKMSYGVSISSTPEQSSNFEREPFKGSKLDLLLSIQGQKDWSFYLMARSLSLTSNNESLSLTRLGVGLGYRFF